MQQRHTHKAVTKHERPRWKQRDTLSSKANRLWTWWIDYSCMFWTELKPVHSNLDCWNLDPFILPVWTKTVLFRKVVLSLFFFSNDYFRTCSLNWNLHKGFFNIWKWFKHTTDISRRLRTRKFCITYESFIL